MVSLYLALTQVMPILSRRHFCSCGTNYTSLQLKHIDGSGHAAAIPGQES